MRRLGVDTVELEVDGVTWRSVPIEIVVKVGLAEGSCLERETLRTVRRELRLLEGRELALRALRSSDRTRASLDERLGARRVVPSVRADVLAALERVGLVDDARVGRTRASALAARGAGDEMIRDDLLRSRIPRDLATEIVDELDDEVDRAQAIVARRGATIRTARYLARRGFAEDTIAMVIADAGPDAVG